MIQKIPKTLPVNGRELRELIIIYHENMMLDRAKELVDIFIQRNQEDKDNYQVDQELFQEINTFHKESIILQEQLKDNQNWTLDIDNQQFKMSYKYIANTPNVALKFESTMKVPIINACALIYQTELFDQWVPFCKISKNLKQVRKGHKIVYILLNVPILKNREAYLRGFGVDRLDSQGSFLICCQTIHQDKQYQQKYKIDITQTNNVQVDVQFFALEVTPISPHEFTMKCVANLDPKMKFIPQTVLNFLIKKIGKFIYERFVHLAQNIVGTPWEQAMKDNFNREFYESVMKRFELHFSKY